MKIKLSSLILACALLIGVQANAQKFNVESMKIELEDLTKLDTERDYESLIKWAGEAAKHPKTANSAKMHYYTGVLNLKLASLNNDLSKEHPNAVRTALASFNKAIETDTKEKYTKQSKANLLNVAIGLYNTGYTAYSAGDYATAYKDFGDAVPLMQYDVDGELKRNNLTAEVLEQMMAYSAMNNGDDKLAKEALQKLVTNGSIEPAIYANLAKLHLKGGDTTKALETVAAGREMNETDKSLINMELDIYLKQGRSEELITKLNAAIDEDPGNTIYYFARAISFEGMGKMEQAAADYDKILEIDPTYYDASYNKGVMYLTKVSTIVDELSGEYKPSIIAKKEAEINELYGYAITQFENVFENNEDMPQEDKTELAGTMKKIYARLERMDKYNEMKSYIESNQ